jgi:hypothetical protein
LGEGVRINDYISTGNEQCQAFTGCSTWSSKFTRRHVGPKSAEFKTGAVKEPINEEEAEPTAMNTATEAINRDSGKSSDQSNMNEKDDDDDIDNDDSKV